ncbi:hypothetical protein EYF80_006118 [Liparis tanakae]|uniref:Uncharacterized protein n=1 Tax=Liparis tanakae TaxID=230148 RepID=A0A4Z2IZZ3_9TELE|nr:hypothetical protein EYF80_006118 [Liparis tanakae]
MDANLREEAKEKWAGPLGEKLRGLSNGLLPVEIHMDGAEQRTYTIHADDASPTTTSSKKHSARLRL